VTLLTVVAFVQLVTVVLILFALAAIGDKVGRIADNAHVTRDGVNSIRRRFREVQTVIDRMELHVRGPVGKYGKPPAHVGPTDTAEVEAPEIVRGP
jgi:hypothetical protein